MSTPITNTDEQPHKPPMIIAHRGYSAKYPDNSPQAFEHALEFPIRMIETDLRVNADGDWYIHHDQVLKLPHTNRTRFFHHLTTPECETLMLLSVMELLAALGPDQINSRQQPISLYLDIKGHPTIDQLVELIKLLQAAYWWAPEQFHLASFNLNVVERLIQLRSEFSHYRYQIGLIGCCYSPYYRLLPDLDFVSSYQDVVNQEYIQLLKVQKPDLKLFVYTINDLLTLQYYYRKITGIDGLLTDDLSLISQLK